ncbi:MAG: glycosyl transferase family 1, partial [Deltaproteobacteria bacterium]|nr:glycosyl transferase family 1 [Deltaproteobacteria bacterium]
GGNPQIPTEAAVERLVQKIRSFLTWLKKTGPVQGVTLSELLEMGGLAEG